MGNKQAKLNEVNFEEFAALDEGHKEDISACTTKIMNTLSFRKLAGKTQVILSLNGPDVRTRLTHTIGVAKIAKELCVGLKLNEDLAEAIALAHDIGHTPFGHVGERTLAEIMCGCDTLNGKIEDCDFINSGFKHNLQTFRVLNNLECVNGTEQFGEIWDLIFWGATAHTKMTYAKKISGMDNEILISAKHCPWVYVCSYHEKKECKRNIQNKKKKKSKNKEEICKPWYCAKLPIIDEESKVSDKEKQFYNDETTREILKKKLIETEYVDHIYCSQKCYLAKLWEYKLELKDSKVYKNYPYLFDHPFPNTFYTNSIAKYFNDKKDYLSLEALIVSQADEIAQHQQDLEDGINKGLLTFNDVKKQISLLIKKYKWPVGSKYKQMDLKSALNSEDLGKSLADFYKAVLINQTKINFQDFLKDEKIVKINIYNFMDILYFFEDRDDKKGTWISEELNSALALSHPIKKLKIDNSLKKYFKIDINPAYFYLFIYEYLEKCTKQSLDNSQEEEILRILFDCISLLKLDLDKLKSNAIKQRDKLIVNKTFIKLYKYSSKLKNKSNFKTKHDFIFLFINTIELLKDYLAYLYPKESKNIFDKKIWKTIGWLKLRSFFALEKISTDLKNKKADIICISDIECLTVEEEYNYKNNSVEIFKIWKETLLGSAYQSLSNIVGFIDKNNKSHNYRKNFLKDFENKQRNAILKSEIVEKNDGKASYILRRLFKAYINNSHQLPDSGLKYIITAILDDDLLEKFLDSEKQAMKNILDKLKKTMLINTTNTKHLKEIPKTTLLEFQTKDKEFKRFLSGKSNEIRAALDKRKELSEYFKDLKAVQDKIIKKIPSEKEEDKNYINEHLRTLRAILDNSILNATNFWESILTRAICDYIANLTDQEAVNEYEKLYAGIMEIV